MQRARLLKLRKVLRAVHKQFPYPPAKFRDEKAVEGFLDDPEFEEENFSDMVLSGRCPSQIVDFALNLHLGAPDVEEDRVSEQSKGNAAKQTETGKVNLLESGDAMDTGMHAETSVTMAVSDSSKRQTNEASLPDVHPNREEPYLEVYENLYHFVSEIEDISASDKWAGFVLTKEGEEFVEQNAKLLKYDLCYNPLRFESWNKLAKIYDEVRLSSTSSVADKFSFCDCDKHSSATCDESFLMILRVKDIGG